MVGWEGAGKRWVRIWPLVAFAVGGMIWPVTWWWSQLRNAQGQWREGSDDAG